MARITDRNDWFDVWFEDRESILNTMIRNMTSDLNAGYNYSGQNITRQKQEIAEYKVQTDKTLDMFKDMDEKAVNRWCFYELKKQGAIS